MMAKPQSCDIFVVLPPLTKSGVIFGKNSDRPQGEIQEIIYMPGTKRIGKTKCTYIEIDEFSLTTKAVVLSKPAWMWGAEMGANECGVAIGNEAVWTKSGYNENDLSTKRLLGMDLVRLGLERASCALAALEIITELLEKYGQGGSFAENVNLFYENSFLIADTKEAWVLETTGKHWAASQVTSGFRNISNQLSITTKIDKKSNGLEEYAKAEGFWDGVGEFNFTKIFSKNDSNELDSSDIRYTSGQKLLYKLTESENFRETDMFSILRDKNSTICRDISNSYPTQSSQVSTLEPNGPSVHWFTGTPDPSKSIFKPFIFTENVVGSKYTQCDDPGTPHNLYRLHSTALGKSNFENIHELLLGMETECVNEVEAMINHSAIDLSEFDELFRDCIETEAKFYR